MFAKVGARRKRRGSSMSACGVSRTGGSAKTVWLRASPGRALKHKLNRQALQVALKQQDDATLAQLAEQFGVPHNAI
jgi:hypothetical protein